MAIAFDSASSTPSQLNPLVWDHTVAASDDMILLVAAVSRATDPNVVSVAFNGVSLSNFTFTPGSMLGADLDNVSSSPTLPLRISLWALIAPDSGTHQIEVLYDSGSLLATAGAISFSGVDPDEPMEGVFGQATGVNDYAPTSGLYVPTFTDDAWVVDFIGSDDETIAVGSGRTSRLNWNAIHVPCSLGISTNGPINPPVALNDEYWSGIATAKGYVQFGLALKEKVAPRQFIRGIGSAYQM